MFLTGIELASIPNMIHSEGARLTSRHRAPSGPPIAAHEKDVCRVCSHRIFTVNPQYVSPNYCKGGSSMFSKRTRIGTWSTTWMRESPGAKLSSTFHSCKLNLAHQSDEDERFTFRAPQTLLIPFCRIGAHRTDTRNLEKHGLRGTGWAGPL